MIINIFHIYIILLIISMELLYLIICCNNPYDNNKIERMTVNNDEAISNIASLYNSKNMTVTNLTVTGKLTAPDLVTNSINTTDKHDWLRINTSANGAGKTAIHGHLAVNEARSGNAGLAVGSWSSTAIGNGVIGTENIKTKAVNTPVGHDWLRINENADSCGRTAIFGNLSVNTPQKGFSGLSVGSFDPGIPNGNINAIGNAKSASVATGNVSMANWKLGVSGGHLVFQSTSNQRELTNPNDLSKHHRGVGNRSGNTYVI